MHVVLGKTEQSYTTFNFYPSVASVHSLLAFNADAFPLVCPEISAELITTYDAIAVGTASVLLRLGTFGVDHRLACGPRSLFGNKEQDTQFDE